MNRPLFFRMMAKSLVKGNIPKISCFIVVFLIAAGLAAYRDFCPGSNERRLIIKMRIEVPGPRLSQVFFNVGDGFRETCSSKIMIDDDELVEHEFRLSPRAIRSIRFDPIDGAGTVHIHAVTVGNRRGEVIKEFDLSDLEAVNDISKIEQQDGILTLNVPDDAKDPVLHIKNSSIEKSDWKDLITKSAPKYLGYGLLSLICLASLNFLLKLMLQVVEFDLRSFPYQPVLAAFFAGVSIYAPNRLYFSVEAMVFPMTILLGLIALALLFVRLFGVDWNKGLVIVSGVLLLNYAYYPITEFVPPQWLNFRLSGIIYGALAAAFVFIVAKLNAFQAKVAGDFMSVFVISIAAITSVNLGLSVLSDPDEQVNAGDSFESQFQSYLSQNLRSSLNNRDFYFIILDRYPGEETLFPETGRDNQDFYRDLRAMKLVVLEKSRSNYGKTDRSVLSMLNMDYYSMAKKDGYREENARLWKFFKSQGFKFVFLPSNWASTTKNNNADVVLNPYPLDLTVVSKNSIFQEIMFFERSFVGWVYYCARNVIFSEAMPSQSANELQKRIQNLEKTQESSFQAQFDKESRFKSLAKRHIPATFESLLKVPRISGRKIVFAHINHWEYIEDTVPLSMARVNESVKALVKTLVEESEPEPVVVILSDHGDRPSAKTIEENRNIYARYASFPNEPLKEDDINTSWYLLNNIQIFHLPEGGDAAVYPGMTPVNIWRSILNYYFRTEFPRLEDKCYWRWRNDRGIREIS